MADTTNPTNKSYNGIINWAKGGDTALGSNTGIVASKVGTATVGSSTKPIYLVNGTPTACSGSLGGVPIGTILPYGGTSLPAGFRWCDGTYLLRTDFAELYAVIGVRYGSKSGSDFRLPLLTENQFLEGSTTPGTYKEAGVPNISGRLISNDGEWGYTPYAKGYTGENNNKYAKGALFVDSYISVMSSRPWGLYAVNQDKEDGALAFEASKGEVHNGAYSNLVYGKSDTVQPKSVTVRYIIKYTNAAPGKDITITKTFTGVLPPTGTVIAWAGTSNVWPEGFLRCDGAAYSRTTYSALYSVIGTTYGYTSSSNFKVPNLQSRFIQGAEGNAVRSDIPAGLPNITASVWPSGGSDEGPFPGICSASGAISTWANGYNGAGGTGSRAYSFDFNASRSSSIYGNSTTVQPPAVAMQYIIKY